jgi:imidazolonepropionase-like amidohydrolase
MYKSLLVAACVVFAAYSVSAQNPVTVNEGGTLNDGNGGPPLPNSVVVIDGARIQAVGARGTVTYPPGARIIKADGMTVLPGLIDAHIHSLDFFPQLFLHFGVTTVYDLSNPTDWIIAQRDALRKGKIKGPRMFVTGEIIDGPDPAEDERRDGYRTQVNTPDEARTLARSLLMRGVDALKVYQNLTPELLRPVVEEAHRAGTEAVGHSHDAKDAVMAGLKFIEHTTPIAHSTIGDPAKLKAMDEGRLRNPEADMNPALFQPLIDLMLKNGVYYNPTLSRVMINALPKRSQWNAEAARLIEQPEYRFIPAARREAWLRTARNTRADTDPRTAEGLRKTQEFTRRYAQAGGRIINGPDSGPSSGPANMAGLAMHVEMEALVDAGLTPMQALQSSTKWSADLLNKKDLGTIAPGKIADVMLIDGNPLADIRATRAIRTVIMDGKVIDTTLDPNFQNPLPRPFAEYEMDNRDPEVESLMPKSARQGGGDLQIEVTGHKFTPHSIVRLDTADLATRFVSESRLTATVKSSLLKQAGTFTVAVINPGPSGGVSKAGYLVVTFP